MKLRAAQARERTSDMLDARRVDVHHNPRYVELLAHNRLTNVSTAVWRSTHELKHPDQKAIARDQQKSERRSHEHGEDQEAAKLLGFGVHRSRLLRSARGVSHGVHWTGSVRQKSAPAPRTVSSGAIKRLDAHSGSPLECF